MSRNWTRRIVGGEVNHVQYLEKKIDIPNKLLINPNYLKEEDKREKENAGNSEYDYNADVEFTKNDLT